MRGASRGPSHRSLFALCGRNVPLRALIPEAAAAYSPPCAEHGAPEDEATPEGRYAQAEKPAGAVDEGATGSANLWSRLSRACDRNGKFVMLRKKRSQFAGKASAGLLTGPRAGPSVASAPSTGRE